MSAAQGQDRKKRDAGVHSVLHVQWSGGRKWDWEREGPAGHCRQVKSDMGKRR